MTFFGLSQKVVKRGLLSMQKSLLIDILIFIMMIKNNSWIMLEGSLDRWAQQR